MRNMYAGAPQKGAGHRSTAPASRQAIEVLLLIHTVGCYHPHSILDEGTSRGPQKDKKTPVS